MRVACLAARAAVLPSVVGGSDVAAGPRSRAAPPGCGHTAPAPLPDRIGEEVATPITAVGDIHSNIHWPDHLHAVVPADRGNLGCLVGPADPCGTAYAAAPEIGAFSAQGLRSILKLLFRGSQ